MKILLLADVESKYLWDHFEKEKIEGYDLIISCGDLKSAYLEFLATFSKVPILYVPGNHDGHYVDNPPDGCINIDDSVYVYKGLRIAGLGGSIWYNGSGYQYTEAEMKSRVKKLKRKIFWKKGVDIFVTHSPARGINDGEDQAHTGFECFREILDKYKPMYYCHGHVHITYGRKHKRVVQHEDTVVINAFERYVIEIPDSVLEERKK